MANGRRRLRLLHVSDLHARGGREDEPWRRRRVLGDAWAEHLDTLLQDGSFDLVAFTGDAADWGRPDEFAEAAEWLHALLDRIALPSERLFVVPGNHDVDRSIGADAWQAVRDAAWQIDPLAFTRWLHGGRPPLGVGPAWREAVFERLAAYRAWVRDDLGRPELVAADGPHAYRQTLDHHGTPIHVIGLDTAWLCGGDDDAGNLRVTDQQAMGQLSDTDGAPLGGFRLVLMHHPLDDLVDTDREVVRRCLAEHADLVLRGHLHSTEVSTWADPDRQLRQLAAGCLYEGHQGDRFP
ncbi:MAG: metallophosphoesterase, partial [Acidobacteriota bacterium]